MRRLLNLYQPPLIHQIRAYLIRFTELAEALGSIQIPQDPTALDSVPDLLQAPMAYGETRDHLLRYYGRTAGADFKTTDDLVAWVRDHRSALDLTRPPRNPFR